MTSPEDVPVDLGIYRILHDGARTSHDDQEISAT
jgi:hypothetical protein